MSTGKHLEKGKISENYNSRKSSKIENETEFSQNFLKLLILFEFIHL